MAYIEMPRGVYPSSFTRALRAAKMIDSQPSSCLQTLTSAAPGLLGVVKRVTHQASKGRPRVFLSLAVITLGLLGARAAKAQVINYPNGFGGATSSASGGSGPIWLENASTLSGSSIQLTTQAQESANNIWYKAPLDVQAFTTTFTWTVTCPTGASLCGDGMGFMIISDPNSTPAGYTYSGYSGGQFSWSQCSGTGNKNCAGMNSVLVKFDLYNNQTGSEGNLTGLYSGGEYPQAPNNPQYDMASSGINMQSGHLMRAVLTYNGTVLSETVSDTVTGSTYTNSYVANIPSLVAGNHAYVGFGGGTGAATAIQNLRSWTYTVESSGQAAPPTFSPAGGTYSASQSVKLASASSGTIICYNTTGSPKPNGSNGCTSGTLYTGPITVSSSETLYAVAGGSGYGNSSVASANYVIQPPNLAQAASPTFSPAGGTYSASQSVKLTSASSGSVICYNTTGNPKTNGSTGCASGTLYTGSVPVSSSSSLYAVAGGTGFTDSPVASANYVIGSALVSAQPLINYPGGFNSAALSSAAGGSGPIWMVESTQAGSQIQLTAIGTDHGVANAWYKTPVNIQAFATTFTFQIECAGGNPTNCASGLGFMIINPSVQPGFTYSGYSGNQFSWSQCTGVYSTKTGFPNSCVALSSVLVKFDIFNIVTGTFGASLTGFCSGGIYCEPPQNVNYDMAPSGINLTSGHVFSATLTYDGSTLSESLTDTSTGARYTQAHSGVNLPSLVGGNTAFVGFGAGTGDTATQNAYLNSWTYSVQ
jgi:hypothetical protein